jgi:hypothetical protein
MPNITQLPVLDAAADQTYFVVVDNKLAKRFNFNKLNEQLSATKAVAVPMSDTSEGVVGQIAYDARYVYICVATNTWRRMAASTF